MQIDGFRDLVRRAQAGDPLAKERLFSLTVPYVERVVRSPAGMIRPEESISDRVQDTCKRIIEKLDQFRGAQEAADDEDAWALFRGWVRQIVRSIGINAGRDRAGPKPPYKKVSLQTPAAGESTDQPGAIDPSGHERTPSSNVRADEGARLVHEALAKLADPKNREIVRLRFFEGMSLREISARLELSYDVVRERYSLSMRRLRGELEGLQ